MLEQQPLSSLTLAGTIDRKTFFRFAIFDSFVRRKGWKNPLFFALILSAFAVICFAMRETHAQAMMLGSVLLSVGMILPLVWICMFLVSVWKQAKRSGLSKDTAQYYVTFSSEKIHVEKGEERADFDWNAVYKTYRFNDCIYLYVSPSRAFLLPDCPDTVRAWELVTEKLDPARVCVRMR